MKKLIGLFVLLVFAASMSYAAETLTDDGTAKAKIIQAATLTHQTGALDFGVIIKSASGGNATLGAIASPTISFTGGLKAASGAVSSDHFILANLDTATSYAVSVPASFTIDDGNSHTMTVTPSLSDTTVTGVASKDIYVGGVLAVGSDQAVGSYEGDYTVTVTY